MKKFYLFCVLLLSTLMVFAMDVGVERVVGETSENAVVALWGQFNLDSDCEKKEDGEEVKVILENQRDENGKRLLHDLISSAENISVETFDEIMWHKYTSHATRMLLVKDSKERCQRALEYINLIFQFSFYKVANYDILSDEQRDQQITQDKIEFIRYVLSQGADKNTIIEGGNLLIYLVKNNTSRCNYQELIEEILKSDDIINVPDIEEPQEKGRFSSHGGRIALHWAANFNDFEMVNLLLQYKADANSANTYGHTPLILIIKEEMFGDMESSKKVVLALLGAGAEANKADNKGRTPLMYAALKEWEEDACEIATLLLQNGADVSIKDNDGKNAFDHAVGKHGDKKGNVGIARMLKEALKQHGSVD